MSEYPKTTGPIGIYIDDGYRITVHCRCRHTSLLDLQALADRYGRDFDLIDNREKVLASLRCEKCGIKGGGQITVTPPADAGMGGAYWRE